MLSLDVKLLMVLLFFTLPKSDQELALSNAQLTRLTGGFEHSLILDEGNVYQFGKNLSFTTASAKANLLEKGTTPLLTRTYAIARGSASQHIVALRQDGTVWTWGNNDLGQLGNGSTISIATPKMVKNLQNIVQVAAGHGHSLALDHEGSVWSWGWNKNGQLGLGNTNDKLEVKKIPNLTEIVDIKAGYHHSIALTSKGEVYAWGKNNNGQLGNGSNENSIRPSRVMRLENIVQISAGSFHNIAVDKEGNAWVWGWNDYAQLGDNTFMNWNIPQKLAIQNVQSASAGGLHTLIVKKDGTVWAWGCNTFGQTSGKKTRNVNQPKQIKSLKNIKEVTAGDLHSLALDKQNKVWTWGLNNHGQLGNGTTQNSSFPMSIYQLKEKERIQLDPPKISEPIEEKEEALAFAPEREEIEVFGVQDAKKIEEKDAIVTNEPTQFKIEMESAPMDTMYHLIASMSSVTDDCPISEELRNTPILLDCNLDKGNISLNWSIKSKNVDRFFIVEHSKNGKRWNELSNYPDVEFKSSNELYSILDEQVANGTNYYRLKHLDCNENYVYSPSVSAQCISKNTMKSGMNFINVEQDKNEFEITVKNLDKKKLMYELVDASGNVLAKKKIKRKLSKFKEGADLAEGTYMLFLIDPKTNDVYDAQKLEKTDD